MKFSGSDSLIVRACFLDGSMTSSLRREPHTHHRGPPTGPCIHYHQFQQMEFQTQVSPLKVNKRFAT